MYKDLVGRLVHDGLGICTFQYKELLLFFFYKTPLCMYSCKKNVTFFQVMERYRSEG